MLKIVSGGQSGVDRAALDFAIENNIDYGGFVPKGFKSEDGGLTKEKYPKMIESKSSDYKVRTEENIIHSDATLIIYKNLSGGTKLTVKYAEKHKKPYLLIKISDRVEESVDAIKKFLKKNNIKVLNVAGNRGSKVPEIYDFTKILLAASITK